MAAFLLLCLVFSVQCQAKETGPSTPTLREQFANEPIFGGSVYILEAGQKSNPPLVLVHGLGDLASDTWRALLPKLAETYHVVTFDLPGFGRSQKQNALYSPGNYAAFVKWVVDTYVTGQPILAGHSLGGAIALRYAGTYPDGLSRLVLIDVAGILDRRVYSKEMLSEYANGLEVLFDVDGLLGTVVGWLPNSPADLNLMLGSDLLRSRVLGSEPTLIAATALILEDFSPYLSRVQVPAAILWGEHDRVTPRRIGTLLEANLKTAQLQIIPGAGHVPMFETPGLFTAAFFSALKDDIRPTGLPAAGGVRQGQCNGKNGMVFGGSYQSIELIDCQNARLNNISAESVRLVRSSAIFDRGSITGNTVGLHIDDSNVTANGLRIEAPVAVTASNSRLDLAGVRLKGSKSAVTTESQVKLLFSVSRIQSPHGSGTIHGLRHLVGEQAL
ncbi:MAG TPA: alpha/beta hydrolase [Malonomonas sp.]